MLPFSSVTHNSRHLNVVDVMDLEGTVKTLLISVTCHAVEIASADKFELDAQAQYQFLIVNYQQPMTLSAKVHWIRALSALKAILFMIMVGVRDGMN